ncbi:MAG TPA: DUF1772 domain-containing protein [Candidatus Acidoferrum sp.]|jgi:uncharacterized membrane protein
MVMVLHVLAVVVLGLMCGSELNVGAFAHPILRRQGLAEHISGRAAYAILFGRVMPFWMTGSALLNLLLLMPFAHLPAEAWRLAAISFGIQVAAVVFSLVGPVPINNRIAKWTVDALPGDWEEQESRWDFFHWVRTVGLMVGFGILVVSLGVCGG